MTYIVKPLSKKNVTEGYYVTGFATRKDNLP